MYALVCIHLGEQSVPNVMLAQGLLIFNLLLGRI